MARSRIGKPIDTIPQGPADGPVQAAESAVAVGDPATIPPESRSIGVIFVHGIGTQPPRETFLNWSNPIVEMLSELRREQDEQASAEQSATERRAAEQPVAGEHAVVGENPVQTGAVEYDEGGGERAWARIAIPASPGHPAATWLLTEAYWAGAVRAPGFGQALRYLRTHISAIIRGIADGYGVREPRRAQRNDEIIKEQRKPHDPRVASQIAELSRSDALRWRWIDWLDKLLQARVIRRTLGVTATVASVATLAIYAPLRAVPIKAIRDRAELALLDAQIVDAFGDLPVLLDDPVQSAIIRQRLAGTIDWVRKRGCDDVVLIAHSGGAIVSFATLLDPAYHELRVAKLMTLGQALALGWRLEQTTGPFVAGNPIRGDLGEARSDLRWVDFWASYDPAPAGELKSVDGTPLCAVPTVLAGKPPSPIQIESRPITNFMNLAEDHDGYWKNDEGFLVPLIRHIDDPRGDGSGSRFYGDRLARAVRIERRRRRVGLLLGWRWLSLVAGVAALGLAILPGVSPAVSLRTTGQAMAALWTRIPGHELLSGPIDGFGAAISAILSAIGVSVAGWAADIGPAILGALLPIVAAFAIYSRGVGSWQATDAAERRIIRREVFGAAGSSVAKSEAILLVAGLLMLVAAAADAPVAVAALLGLAISVSAIVRWSSIARWS
jgi:hypothetical protein